MIINQVSLIFRFEKLDTDGNLFLDYINYANDVDLPFVNYRKQSNGSLPTQVACEYFSRLDVSLIKKLELKYFSDLLIGEYSAKPYYNCANNI